MRPSDESNTRITLRDMVGALGVEMEDVGLNIDETYGGGIIFYLGGGNVEGTSALTIELYPDEPNLNYKTVVVRAGVMAHYEQYISLRLKSISDSVLDDITSIERTLDGVVFKGTIRGVKASLAVSKNGQIQYNIEGFIPQE